MKKDHLRSKSTASKGNKYGEDVRDDAEVVAEAAAEAAAGT